MWRIYGFRIYIKNDNFGYVAIAHLMHDKYHATHKTMVRVGQGVYRSGLLAKYNKRCVITGINHPKLLIASHIKPWSVCENDERIDVENGLLLSANMDKLFDCGLITFSNTGDLSVSSFVGKENVKKLNISSGTCVDLKASTQLLNYLEYHRDMLFVR